MSLRKNKKGTRDNLIYNTRQWEKRNGVYYTLITLKEAELSKDKFQEFKNEIGSKGMSVSNYIIKCINEYMDKKGGNDNVNM